LNEIVLRYDGYVFEPRKVNMEAIAYCG
jgi:hypothetical protein